MSFKLSWGCTVTTKISQCRLNANTSDLRPILSEQWVGTTLPCNSLKIARKCEIIGLESTLADNQCLTTTIVNHSNLNEKSSVTTNQFTLPNLKRLARIFHKKKYGACLMRYNSMC